MVWIGAAALLTSYIHAASRRRRQRVSTVDFETSWLILASVRSIPLLEIVRIE
jgi:hypothetical protein